MDKQTIIFSQKIYTIIEGFIDYRIGYFERLYSETGIFGEDIIIERYREESQNISREIVKGIISHIERWIFGNIYQNDDQGEFSRLVLKTPHHICIVWIRRERTTNHTFIEDIEIQT